MMDHITNTRSQIPDDPVSQILEKLDNKLDKRTKRKYTVMSQKHHQSVHNGSVIAQSELNS